VNPRNGRWPEPKGGGTGQGWKSNLPEKGGKSQKQIKWATSDVQRDNNQTERVTKQGMYLAKKKL